MSSSAEMVKQTTDVPALPDGSRFALAAPETIRFPGEEMPVLRALDSFVFLVKGKPIPLFNDWMQNKGWVGIEIIGAAATMKGPTAALVQCGWLTRVKWRWIRISTVLRVEIRQDSRFRKGEPCFWLTTRLGEYALLAPHRGYTAAWGKSISQPDVPTPTPSFCRMSEHDPMPTWWDPAWGETWPPSVPQPTSGIKRTASSATALKDIPPGLAELLLLCDSERRVRRREDGQSIVADGPGALACDSALGKPAVQENVSMSGQPGEAKPELGVKMSRLWDIARDGIEKPRGTNKPQQPSQKM